MWFCKVELLLYYFNLPNFRHLMLNFLFPAGPCASRPSYPTNLSNLCWGSIILTMKRSFITFKWKQTPAFQFVHTACSPAIGHYWKGLGSFLFAPCLQVFVHMYDFPPEPSLLHAEQSLLSQLFFTEEMFQFLHYLNSWTLIAGLFHFSSISAQNRAQYLRYLHWAAGSDPNVTRIFLVIRINI